MAGKTCNRFKARGDLTTCLGTAAPALLEDFADVHHVLGKGDWVLPGMSRKLGSIYIACLVLSVVSLMVEEASFLLGIEGTRIEDRT